MPENPILFCTDFSENARLAFPHAIRATQLSPGTELHILHIIPAPDAQYWKPYIYNTQEDVDSNAKKILDQQIQDCWNIPRLGAAYAVHFRSLISSSVAYHHLHGTVQ